MTGSSVSSITQRDLLYNLDYLLLLDDKDFSFDVIKQLLPRLNRKTKLISKIKSEKY